MFLLVLSPPFQLSNVRNATVFTSMGYILVNDIWVRKFKRCSFRTPTSSKLPSLLLLIPLVLYIYIWMWSYGYWRLTPWKISTFYTLSIGQNQIHKKKDRNRCCSSSDQVGSSHPGGKKFSCHNSSHYWFPLHHHCFSVY